MALRRTMLDWIRTLYTGYFACVMATGIVSVALLLDHQTTLSDILWVISFALLAYLIVVYIVRAVRFGGAMWRDASDPATAFGFFTFIAALGVVSTRSALAGWALVPGIMTGIAVVVWFVFTYWTFAMLIFTNEKPIDRALNGSWLIAIVATEALANTWVLLAAIQPTQRDTLQLMAYAYWTFGVLLYLIFIALIMYRFFFLRVQPGDLTPPYWINMGAMAITTVAGVRLLETPKPSAFLATLHPYIEGFTVMMWAWGTWWIPLLLVIGFWKYGVSRERIRYQPALWSIVFPLGMYATAIQLVSTIPGLGFLEVLGPACVWVAFAAWALVALGWIASAVNTARAGVGGPAVSRAPDAVPGVVGEAQQAHAQGAPASSDGSSRSGSAQPGAQRRAALAGGASTTETQDASRSDLS